MRGRPGASHAGGGRELVAEHRDLDLRLGPNAIVRPKHAKDAAQDEVEDWIGSRALSQIKWCRARIRRQSGLFTPRVPDVIHIAEPEHLFRRPVDVLA